MQQGLIPPGQPHHGVVDGGVAMGVQLHSLAHDVGAFRPGRTQKPHFIHGEKQFPVGGLEAVDLRDGPGEDDAHGVGHKILPQGIADILLDDLACPGDKPLHFGGSSPEGLPLFLCHILCFPPLFKTRPGRPGILPRDRQYNPSGRSGCPPAAHRTSGWPAPHPRA